MSEVFSGLVGRKVAVYSAGGNADYTDTGVVVAVDDLVLTIRAGEKVLVFPLARVRLIRLDE